MYMQAIEAHEPPLGQLFEVILNYWIHLSCW